MHPLSELTEISFELVYKSFSLGKKSTHLFQNLRLLLGWKIETITTHVGAIVVLRLSRCHVSLLVSRRLLDITAFLLCALKTCSVLLSLDLQTQYTLWPSICKSTVVCTAIVNLSILFHLI